MKVAVTGASGFIGGRLIERLCLDGGVPPVAILRASSPRYHLSPFACEVRAASLADLGALEAAFNGCDAVVHCAFDFSPLGRTALVEQNLVGLYNVVQAARKAGVGKMVHLSSVAVYGYGRHGMLDETTPYEGEPDAYAEAKQRCEALLDLTARGDGPSVALLQLGIVYGPRAYWATSFAERARKGRLVLPDDGAGICNAVYVDDVISAILATLANLPGAALQRYLVTGPAICTWQDYASYFLEACGQRLVREDAWVKQERRAQRAAPLRRTLRHIYRPLVDLPGVRPFLEPMGRWARRTIPTPIGPELSEFPVFSNRATYSGKKAQEELGYRAQVDLRAGMALTLAWLRFARLLPEEVP